MDASTRNNLTTYLKLLHRQRGEPSGVYDDFATVWDQNVAAAALAHFNHLIKEKVNPGAMILDAGVGTGERTLALLQHCQPSEIIALVASETMLEAAKTKIRDPRVRFMQADVRHLPFADSTFDVVASTWVIEYMDDPQVVMQECIRVVKPGGFVIYAFCGLFVVCQKDGQEYA